MVIEASTISGWKAAAEYGSAGRIKTRPGPGEAGGRRVAAVGGAGVGLGNAEASDRARCISVTKNVISLG